MSSALTDNRTFFQALAADGRPAFFALSLGLMAAGGAALFLAATGHFLPHDEQFLGMSAEQLCGYQGCRVVHFMVHDRASFGGVVLAIGLLYLWLTEFPLRARRAWAWWALLLSGSVGFASFLAYIGYGYLDVWHGVATLALVPCFAVGLIRSWPTLAHPRGIMCLLTPGDRPRWRSVTGISRICLMIAALGVTGAGLTILSIGMTAVFVPTDLEFMGVGVGELHALNPRLVPLIAHDRAGFGGALLSVGVAAILCIWCGRPSPALWQVLLLAGIAGFTPAIGVHFAIGYTDPIHLAPAVTGAVLYAVGLVLSYRPMFRPGISDS
jgi:MFS family permease